MNNILKFFAEYWVSFLFGLIGAGLTAGVTILKNRYKRGKQLEQEEELIEPLRQDVSADIQELKHYVDNKDNQIEKNGSIIHQQIQENFEKEELIVLEQIADLKEIMLKQFQEVDNKLQETNQASEKRFQKIDDNFRAVSEEADVRRAGLLCLFKKTFVKDCDALLEKDHAITVEEYIQISKDHAVYNSLGGNHSGDERFKAVSRKYNEQSL